MRTAVIGATGTQGGAVVRALLEQDLSALAVVRNGGSDAARDLQAMGARIVAADMEDEASLRTALDGVDALFSMQLAPSSDPDSERRQTANLAAAAKCAGVQHVVHSSVSNTGAFQTMPGWKEGLWARNYWESKRDAEGLIQGAGFSSVTILRPAFLMENFAQPKALWMFPDLVGGELATVLEPETPMVMVAASDVARAAVAALRDPARFGGQVLELAGDLVTMPAIAHMLSRITGSTVRACTLSADELLARGWNPGWVEMQEWMNAVNYPARPDEMVAWGLTPTRFDTWASDHRARIEIASHR